METTAALVHVASGTAAGMSAVLLDYPLDTLKTRAQVGGCGGGCGGGYLQCLRDIVAYEGPRALYRGISAPLLAQGVEMAVVFSAYRACGEAAARHTEWAPHTRAVASSAAAGAAVSLVLAPVEYVKCNLQLRAGAGRPSTVRRLVARTLARDGVRGLYCGLGATTARAVPGNVAYFLTYEAVAARLHLEAGTPGDSPGAHAPPPVWQTLLAGGLSGCAYWSVAYPADVVRARLQVDADFSARCSGRLSRGLAVQYRCGGLRSLYRGLGIANLKAFPSGGVVFTVYEWCVHSLSSSCRRSPTQPDTSVWETAPI